MQWQRWRGADNIAGRNAEGMLVEVGSYAGDKAWVPVQVTSGTDGIVAPLRVLPSRDSPKMEASKESSVLAVFAGQD